LGLRDAGDVPGTVLSADFGQRWRRLFGIDVADIGSLDVIDGRIEGNRISWKMPTEKPMPMTLVAKALVDGDTMEGTVVMGAFGSAKMTAKRRAGPSC
jgi:hypothetical protein